MQFIPNGPDIPETLLQAHEEGRVVFFCGAGISYKVGLKDFQWLVDEISQRCGMMPLKDSVAYKSERYDIILNNLEEKLLGQRAGLKMRKALAEVLTPDFNLIGAESTHKALLHLSQDRKGVMRLVTTNFDRSFEFVRHSLQIKCNMYAAPMLPIPKNSRWDGLVYLHGLLPDVGECEQGLDYLVVTSGDFGLAYLTERWAARFVSELFRNFMVCFVGYSINDPVLRYMMDALAADRLRGEATPQAYALAAFTTGCERTAKEDWFSKGIYPILYDSVDDHRLLHETLRGWADDYSNGIQGKERIVIENAIANPAESTVQDDFIGRMLWALSDLSGLPAKLFAYFNPVPPIEWLEVFSDERYTHHDLSRFGVTSSDTKADEKFRFSLIRRPAPFKRTPFMSLVSSGRVSSEWDDVMSYLALWLTRHLNEPALIIWLAQRGGQLHERLQWMIEKILADLAGKTVPELDEIRSNSPNAIPGPLMLPLWNLFLSGRVKSNWHEPGLYRWMHRLKYAGRLTVTMRFELRELLSLKVRLKKPFFWGDDKEQKMVSTHIRELVDFEFVLASEHIRSFIDIAKNNWHKVLPELMDDFQVLLRDALDLMNELGEAEEHRDPSIWHLPSISEHWQNRGFSEWLILIEFLRDAWLRTLEIDPPRARRFALGWFDIPYLTFKRLAFFAASQDNGIEPEQWVEWLVSDNSYWLWTHDAQREVMRLLTLQGGSLTLKVQERLETAILTGPPSDLFEGEHRKYLIDRSVWLRLAKLSASGLVLGFRASERLKSIAVIYPDWAFEPHEREEFAHWMSCSGDPDYQRDVRDVDAIPHKKAELVEWLKQFPEENDSGWRDSCRARFCHSLCALSDLAKEEIWQEKRWVVALQVWSEDRYVRRSWRYASPWVSEMSDSFIENIASGLAWWLKEVSKSIDRDGDRLMALCRRLLILPFEVSNGVRGNGEPEQDPVSAAINHPVGHVTQALINLWFKFKPNDHELLPEPFRFIFSELCDVGVQKFRHGRVLLALNLVSLFRVDREWTMKHLLPLFEWDRDSEEACAVWRGFLYSPRVHSPLMIVFKSEFLSTANHYKELGEFSSQYAAFLTYAALGSVDGYMYEDFYKAIITLPPEGLQVIAQTLKQALDGAGDKRETYWRNKIRVFLQKIWPKLHELRTEKLAGLLALLCIEAGDEFPSALSELSAWFMPIESSDYLVMRLWENGHCKRFPAEVLRLLDLVITVSPVLYEDLEKCLDAVVTEKPELKRDGRYLKLMGIVRMNAR
ncbi:anti-phage defense-associated sirtuin Dsr1 [Chlorobium sp.]|uniref:anti-phage defense-associated sirtuin Dsr1 n=1 Tax=Chlorobium sp. TaxID=1095 RepID=UPI003C628533